MANTTQAQDRMASSDSSVIRGTAKWLASFRYENQICKYGKKAEIFISKLPHMYNQLFYSCDNCDFHKWCFPFSDEPMVSQDLVMAAKIEDLKMERDMKTLKEEIQEVQKRMEDLHCEVDNNEFNMDNMENQLTNFKNQIDQLQGTLNFMKMLMLPMGMAILIGFLMK